jgi:hypothetical protein
MSRPVYFAVAALLLASCKPDASKQAWETISEEPSVYPPDSITVHRDTVLGLASTTRVNRAYKNYRFKSRFPESIVVVVNDPRILAEGVNDSMNLELYFFDAMRDSADVHFVGSVLTAEELNIYYYADKVSAAFDLVEPGVSCTFRPDPEWTQYKQLLDVR